MGGNSKLRTGALLCAMILGLSACDTRSISDSGYRGDGGRGAYNAFYRGELSEYDVLGIDPRQAISDDEIRKALVAKQPIAIKRGSAVMLVQSGAMFADPEMSAALGRYYAVSSFSGVPMPETQGAAQNQSSRPSYSQLFRLAAAKGGFDTIIVYWGVLESASENLDTKAISWIPIIGGVIPDQAQRMRIRLMIAVIDVKTGQWESFASQPFDDEAASNEHHRAASDQQQVALLKAKAYQAAAEQLVDRYGR